MKKKNTLINKLIILNIITIFLTSAFTTGVIGTNNLGVNNNEISLSKKTDDSTYFGQLRIYVVEPVSRWNTKEGDPYSFGFLDFAFNDEISIEYQDTFSETVIWNSNIAGFNNIEESNIMVIAAVFNPVSNKKYAYPPVKNPFDAYYVDAAAGAIPGITGQNMKTENFTHTVFIDQATATYCQFCPSAANALKDIYDSQDYPFYYVALVGDKNDIAYERLKNDYNLYAYPTIFMDDGYKTKVGGGYSENSYRISIESCGLREVHDLDLTLSVEWKGDNTIEINVNITNNEKMSNMPPNTLSSMIKGPETGKIRTPQEFTIKTTDPNKDNIYYYIEWGDGQIENWIGPYNSGEEIIISHLWSEQETYKIKAKAKDEYGEESDWNTIEITVPKSKILTKNDNNPPNPPDITGPLSGKIKETYVYYITVTDPDEDDYLLQLEVDFGDGVVFETCGCDIPWNNGETIEVEHRWKKSGNYEIKARVMDVLGLWSNWSEPISVSMPKNKSLKIYNLLQIFQECYPNLFNILNQILKL